MCFQSEEFEQAKEDQQLSDPLTLENIPEPQIVSNTKMTREEEKQLKQLICTKKVFFSFKYIFLLSKELFLRSIFSGKWQ